MSAERSGKSHAVAWTSAPFVALLLYVATWPPIEIKSTTVIHPTTITHTGGKAIISGTIQPAWLEVYWPIAKASRLRWRTRFVRSLLGVVAEDIGLKRFKLYHYLNPGVLDIGPESRIHPVPKSMGTIPDADGQFHPPDLL